jgi:hypothetical protein
MSCDPLTAEQLRAHVDYNPDTGEFRWKVQIGRGRIGARAGYVGWRGYRNIRIFGKLYKEHRLAWLYSHGHWPVGILDHEDGDPANNALANLREATLSQNRANNIKDRGYSKKNSKFQARIQVNGQRVYLGTHATESKARAAYEAASLKLFGAFSGIHRGVK